jgi:hypothetical protein
MLVVGLWTVVPHASAQVNVTQEHNNPSRDGVYVDPAFRSSEAANLTATSTSMARFPAMFTRNHFTSMAARVGR